MISRRYNSPGVEINEIDKSQYGIVDSSVVNTTTLIAGFADKGDDYDTKWVLSLRDFVETYGYPTNEAERYFYTAAKTIFDQGGRVFANKLPYDNNSRNKFSFVSYHVDCNNLSSTTDLSVSEITKLDSSIKNLCVIKAKADAELEDDAGSILLRESGLLEMDDLDNLLTKLNRPVQGDIIIVDKTRGKYGRNPSLESIDANKNTYQYLGVVPVIVSPVNALYYQYLINENVNSVSSYSLISEKGFKLVKNAYNIPYRTTDTSNGTNTILSAINSFTLPLEIKPDFRDNESVSKTASLLFPTISYMSEENFEKDYLKQIGVVVFKMVLDKSNNNSVNFIPNEVFIGSLNKDAKNVITNEKIFIDDIINSRSQLINFFSNVPFEKFNPNVESEDPEEDYSGSKDEKIFEIKYRPTNLQSNLTDNSTLKQTKDELVRLEDDLNTEKTTTLKITKEDLTSIISGRVIQQSSSAQLNDRKYTAYAPHLCDAFYIANQTITSLGFYMEDCRKYISVKTSILDALDIAMKNIEDPNRIRIDVVLDAGISNIAQYIHTLVEAQLKESETNYLKLVDEIPLQYDPTSTIYNTILDQVNQNTTGVWRKVLNKFDNFTKNIRKDCLFVADGPRHLCIVGNQKIVRKTKPRNTIKDNILPSMKYMTAFDSSYSCGYCDWFYIFDEVSQSYFWCPPSIQAGGQFVYTDRMYAPWEAPAGLNRGVLENAYDVAFTPKPEEAEVIYNSRWNYALSYPLDGIVLDGQKTWQKEKTARDRINVRRLLLMLEKDVRDIAKDFKYEGITTQLLNQFRDQLVTYLSDIKNRNGIIDFAVVCDERNNTNETIENNEIHATIGVIPVKTAEWIIINAICANQSANINEVVQAYSI